MTSEVNNLPIYEDNEAGVQNVFKKELLSVPKPFNFFQALYLLSMYRIRNGFIIPNSIFYNVLSGIWSLLLLASYFFSIFKSVIAAGLVGINFVKCFSNIFVFCLYCFGNVTSYWTNVTQGHNSVKLAISIQNICEMLNVNGKSLKNFTLLNWIYVSTLVGCRVIWIVNLNIAYSAVFQFYEIVTNVFYIIFDINILYCVRLMKLLSESLRVWVDEAHNSKCVADTKNELYWNGKFRIYFEVAETYEIVGKTFQILILYFCTDTFTSGVLSIWMRIELTKVVRDSMIKVTLSLVSLLWVVKSIILISALSLECERFYFIMSEVHCTCIQLTTSGTCSEAQKRVCKNIQRDQTTTFKKMSACGLFIIDGELPLLLFSLLTTYIIVVLQFEFL